MADDKTIKVTTVVTPESESWEQKRNQIAFQVKRENDAKRDEVLRAQGKDPASASVQELKAANEIVNQRGEYKSINQEVKRQIGDQPQPELKNEIITQQSQDLTRSPADVRVTVESPPPLLPPIIEPVVPATTASTVKVTQVSTNETVTTIGGGSTTIRVNSTPTPATEQYEQNKRTVVAEVEQKNQEKINQDLAARGIDPRAATESQRTESSARLLGQEQLLDPDTVARERLGSAPAPDRTTTITTAPGDSPTPRIAGSNATTPNAPVAPTDNPRVREIQAELERTNEELNKVQRAYRASDGDSNLGNQRDQLRAKTLELRNDLARETNQGPATGVFEGRDDNTGQYRYKNPVTGTSFLSSTAPTAEQQAASGVKIDPPPNPSITAESNGNIVKTTVDPNNGNTTTTVTDANGQTVASGPSAQVQQDLSQNSDPNNQELTATVIAQETSLTNAQAAASPSDTATTSTSGTNAARVTTGPAVLPRSISNTPAADAAPAAPPTAAPAATRTAAAEDSGARATTAQTAAVQVQAQANQAEKSGPLLGDNPLYNLADFTYSFVLIALTPKDYNELAKNPGKPVDRRQNVIIAGGSRNNEKLVRDPEFTSDFYITDLKFDTIVGLNSRTKGSNAISLSFKIVEPLGASFFERLYNMSARLGIPNYLESPYLLIIEFRGNTDDGMPVNLKDHSKYIPIKIIRGDMHLTASGSEYNIEAIPYNHLAFDANEFASAKINVTVTADTVGTFFANSGDQEELSKEIANDERTLRTELENLNFLSGFATVDQDTKLVTAAIDKRIEQARKKQYNAESYTQAINAFQLYAQKQQKIGNFDDYRFEIDPQIANSKIVDPNIKPATASPTTPGAITKSQFSITAGTNIIEVINLVMRSSDYIRNQIDTTKVKIVGNAVDIANDAGKPLDWYKIIPSITIKEFDSRRNTYSRTITYSVVPYKVYNTKSSLVPKSFPSKWLNEYDYIFTGNNKGILDLDLRFEVMFYQLTTVNRGQWDPWNSAPGAPEDKDFASSNAASNSFAPIKTVAMATYIPGQIGTPANDAKGIAVSELYTHLLSNMRGDLINLRMKIVGDPRYIKQDDLFYNTSNSPALRGAVSNNNSVVFDFEERYVKVTFLTPLDYGDNGLLNIQDLYRTSKFSGLYRILTIENVFSRGKFEQTLELIRLFDQPGDTPVKSREDPSFREVNEYELQGERAFTTPVPDTKLKSIELTVPTGPTGTAVKTSAVDRVLAGFSGSSSTAGPQPIQPKGVTEADRLEAARINREANAPANDPAITPQQVANNRTLNARLTRSFGINGTGTVSPPSREDYTGV